MNTFTSYNFYKDCTHMKGIKTLTLTIIILIVIQSTVFTQSQVPDPKQGLRAEWMRGTYGLNWKPAKSAIQEQRSFVLHLPPLRLNPSWSR
ncbi:hypothetical protein ACFLT1_04500, partial [Bacteroidota bacterium]